jgi:hypothetical protein
MGKNSSIDTSVDAARRGRAPRESLHAKQAQGDCLAHGFITGVAGMQLVSAVEGGENFVRVRRVANGFIEIHETVEALAGADPGIDRFTDLGFFWRPVTALDVAFTLERCKSRADDLDSFLIWVSPAMMSSAVTASDAGAEEPAWPISLMPSRISK